VAEDAELTTPKANIPLVLFPAAEPRYDAALAVAAVPFASVENVYLLRVFNAAHAQPKANIPIVPGPPAAPAPNPKAFAENAPLVITAGMSGSLKLGLGGELAECSVACLHDCIRVNIHAACISACRGRAALPLRSD